jgi:hypothetical protein
VWHPITIHSFAAKTMMISIFVDDDIFAPILASPAAAAILKG